MHVRYNSVKAMSRGLQRVRLCDAAYEWVLRWRTTCLVANGIAFAIACHAICERGIFICLRFPCKRTIATCHKGTRNNNRTDQVKQTVVLRGMCVQYTAYQVMSYIMVKANTLKHLPKQKSPLVKKRRRLKRLSSRGACWITQRY